MCAQPSMPIPSKRTTGTDVGAPDRGDASDRALARSVLYGAVALAFHFPDAEVVRRLASRAAQDAIREAAAFVDGATGRLRRAAERFVHGIGAESAGHRAEGFARLFGHTARGAVCVYETEYGSETLYGQPQTVADIAGYYLAFGLQPAGFARERADHVGCECAFMGFLSLKEARSLEAINSPEESSAAHMRETLEETRRVSRQFLRDHLARFGAAFARYTLDADGDGFYGSAAAVLLALLEVECERLGVLLGPPVLELRSTADDHVPMSCGGGEPELIQIQRTRP